MALLPPITRLVLESFPKDEQKWIGLLIQPLNQVIESVYAALNRGLTLKENISADIREIDVDGTTPVKLAWTLKSKPVAVYVGDVRRVDGTAVSLVDTVGVKWSFNQAGQLQLDQVLGIAPTPAAKYRLTLVCFTG